MIDIDKLADFCKRNNYNFRLHGDSPSVVLIGEQHHNGNLVGQEQIIELVKPKIILHEAADPNLSFRYHTSRILSWQKKYGIPVERCDLPYASFDKDEITKTSLEQAIKPSIERLGIRGVQAIVDEMLWPAREATMGEKIIQYVRKNQTPVVACFGNGHVRQGSGINVKLSNEYIDYVVIVQNLWSLGIKSISTD